MLQPWLTLQSRTTFLLWAATQAGYRDKVVPEFSLRSSLTSCALTVKPTILSGTNCYKLNGLMALSLTKLCGHILRCLYPTIFMLSKLLRLSLTCKTSASRIALNVSLISTRTTVSNSSTWSKLNMMSVRMTLLPSGLLWLPLGSI